MASDLEQSLVRLGEKSRLLADRYKVAIAQRDSARQQNQQLTKQLAECQKTIEQLNVKLQYYSIASAIAPNRDQLDEARATIAELVREIDRCIADLAD